MMFLIYIYRYITILAVLIFVTTPLNASDTVNCDKFIETHEEYDIECSEQLFTSEKGIYRLGVHNTDHIVLLESSVSFDINDYKSIGLGLPIEKISELDNGTKFYIFTLGDYQADDGTTFTFEKIITMDLWLYFLNAITDVSTKGVKLHNFSLKQIMYNVKEMKIAFLELYKPALDVESNIMDEILKVFFCIKTSTQVFINYNRNDIKHSIDLIVEKAYNDISAFDRATFDLDKITAIINKAKQDIEELEKSERSKSSAQDHYDKLHNYDVDSYEIVRNNVFDSDELIHSNEDRLNKDDRLDYSESSYRVNKRSGTYTEATNRSEGNKILKPDVERKPQLTDGITDKKDLKELEDHHIFFDTEKSYELNNPILNDRVSNMQAKLITSDGDIEGYNLLMLFTVIIFLVLTLLIILLVNRYMTKSMIGDQVQDSSLAHVEEGA